MEITIRTQLSLSDFEKLNYHLMYSKLVNKGMTGMGVFLISLGLLVSITEEFQGTLLVMGLFFVGYLPLIVKLTAKGNYTSNLQLSEKITYTFDKEQIQITGESFNSRFTWDKIHKVTESKNWVLIWQSRQVANAIPKRDFTDEVLFAI